ncbi:MAG: hypothetical protein LBK43_06395, partial [Treponema sp.]|nr:hypothetical protein [Treponema sp.]
MKFFKKTVFILLLFALVIGPVFARGAGETGKLPVVFKEVVPLERNGISLYLAKYETADEAAKKPILFVHGLTYSSHEFDVDYGD